MIRDNLRKGFATGTWDGLEIVWGVYKFRQVGQVVFRNLLMFDACVLFFSFLSINYVLFYRILKFSIIDSLF